VKDLQYGYDEIKAFRAARPSERIHAVLLLGIWWRLAVTWGWNRRPHLRRRAQCRPPVTSLGEVWRAGKWRQWCNCWLARGVGTRQLDE